jgi:hypothetical protein
METCSLCTASAKPSTAPPCADFCVNVVRGCVAGRSGQFQQQWDDFAGKEYSPSLKNIFKVFLYNVFVKLHDEYRITLQILF